MKRKIIELGHECMVISLPRKWVLKHNLKKGTDLSVEQQDEGLIITTSEKQHSIKEIHVNLEDVRETLTRTVLVNNYRIGYDRMIVQFSGKKQELHDIVEKHLLGFEVFSQENNTYIIESISEPSYDQFENIIHKIFFILKTIIMTFEQEDIDDEVRNIQKYDNFLKRCISKTAYDPRAKMFIWQFLSDLSHIAREFLHLKKSVSTKPSEYETSITKRLQDMISVIETAYMQKNMDIVKQLHQADEQFVSERKVFLTKVKDPVRAYYYLHIARLLFLLNSPLIGILSSESHDPVGVQS